jgi:hypothetical protein
MGSTVVAEFFDHHCSTGHAFGVMVFYGSLEPHWYVALLDGPHRNANANHQHKDETAEQHPLTLTPPVRLLLLGLATLLAPANGSFTGFGFLGHYRTPTCVTC